MQITSDDLVASLDALGARLARLRFRGHDVLLHAPPTDAWTACCPGVVVGPVANRVAGGTAQIGGNSCQMPQSEGTNCLHSGPNGLHARIWDVAAQSESSVTFEIRLASGDIGLPGERDIAVRYSVHAATLTVEMTATTDTPTPMNLAHHPYWHLGPDPQLEVRASHYLPTDAANLPTGEIALVRGTPRDHRHLSPVARDTDHNFCVSDAPTETPQRMARLVGGGLQLIVESTAPGLQVYAGAGLPDLPDTPVAPGAGIALEAQHWPDAMRHRNFPDIVITPSSPYRQITRYSLYSAT